MNNQKDHMIYNFRLSRLLLICLLSIGIHGHAQYSQDENYVATKTYLEAVTASSTTAKGSATVTYFDGLGRPKQTVNIKATPQGNDVVTHIEYDGFGRQVKDYLPVPQTGSSDGAIYSLNPLSNAGQVYGTEKIYAEKVLENSPLDRLFQQIQPGTDWQDHPVTYDYQTNTATDVLRFSTDTRTSGGALHLRA
jgi:hypothetical protein